MLALQRNVPRLPAQTTHLHGAISVGAFCGLVAMPMMITADYFSRHGVGPCVCRPGGLHWASQPTVAAGRTEIAEHEAPFPRTNDSDGSGLYCGTPHD
jgi:hypothetical protein